MRQDYFPYLSALRGLAALWVVMAHVAVIPTFLLPWLLAVITRFGVMGVNLFFLVSAFSLCLSMPKHDDEARPYLGFLLRRFFRIAPLFYAMVALSFVYNPSDLPHTYGTVLANLTFVFNFLPGRGYQSTSLVFAGWTIGVEMAFYLVFPFIYARTRSIGRACVALVASLILSLGFRLLLGFLTGSPNAYVNQTVFTFAPIFMCGIVAFYVVKAAGNWRHRRLIGAALLVSVPVQFFLLVYNVALFVDPLSSQGPMFGCLLVGLALLPIKVLVNKVTVWLGKISYSVYLVHGPIVVSVLVGHKAIQGAALGVVTSYTLTLALVLALVVPSATVTFYLWENPINEWGKRFASRVAGGGKPAGRPITERAKLAIAA